MRGQLGMLVVVVTVLGCGTEADMIGAARRLGRLAPLPASAHEVRAATVGNMFARHFFLRFAASPPEIEQFLRESPGIQDGLGTPRSSHQHGLGTGQPDWFLPEPLRNSRLHSIPEQRGSGRGNVWVDDDRHVVYVLVCSG